MNDNNEQSKDISIKTKQKSNIFLLPEHKHHNDPIQSKYSNKQNKQNEQHEQQMKSNIFANEIGKTNIHLTQSEKKREIDINNSDLFPDLINDFNQMSISSHILKKIKKPASTSISYADITKNKEEVKKTITYDIDPGWVHLYMENHQIKKLYGPETEKGLELERKEQELKRKKEIDEWNNYIKKIEEDRYLRKEIYGGHYDVYDPNTDIYRIKEKDIILYTSNEASDSDTEGSYTNEYIENDYDTIYD